MMFAPGMVAIPVPSARRHHRRGKPSPVLLLALLFPWPETGDLRFMSLLPSIEPRSFLELAPDPSASNPRVIRLTETLCIGTDGLSPCLK